MSAAAVRSERSHAVNNGSRFLLEQPHRSRRSAAVNQQASPIGVLSIAHPSSLTASPDANRKRRRIAETDINSSTTLIHGRRETAVAETSNPIEQTPHQYGQRADLPVPIVRRTLRVNHRHSTNPHLAINLDALRRREVKQYVTANNDSGSTPGGHSVHRSVSPEACLSPAVLPNAGAHPSLPQLRRESNITADSEQPLTNAQSTAAIQNDGKCDILEAAAVASTDANSNSEQQSHLIAGRYRIVDDCQYRLTRLNCNGPSNGRTAPYNVEDTVNGEVKLCQELTNAQFVHLLRVTQRLNDAEKYWPHGDCELLRSKLLPNHGYVVTGNGNNRYLLTTPLTGSSLHAYVQGKQFLNEEEAQRLFAQVARLVSFCHSVGIVLRDLKLRKFLFDDPNGMSLRLDSIDDVVVCPTPGQDLLNDRHGCPAYVSPEIIDSTQNAYSGKSADMWSLGVLLFVMVVGRYPFYASTPSSLFAKIRMGYFCIPEDRRLSVAIKMVMVSLLRKNPLERPDAHDLLCLPWLQSGTDRGKSCRLQSEYGSSDQLVPDVSMLDSD